MDKNKIIEEMAKIIKKTYEEHEAFNPKWFAEAIYDKIFSDGAVVLTKEEYERLKALPEKVHDKMDEKMKEEIAIEKRMGEDKLERFENNMKNVLEIEKENVRKETATEILKFLKEKGTFTYDYPDEPHSPIIIFSDYILEELAEKYGVEMEE